MSEKLYLIINEPGSIPERKRPFGDDNAVQQFIFECIICRPADTRLTLISVAEDGDIWPTDAVEYLCMARKQIRTRRVCLTSITRKFGERTAAKLAGKRVRIWSDEHRAYWRRNGNGYTDGKREAAWLLPFEEAFKQVSHCGPEKRISFEVPELVRWSGYA